VAAAPSPTYYLNTDAPLYYYSFTDAWIAMAYKSLNEEQRAHLDPMITGFNPIECMLPIIYGGCFEHSQACLPGSANSRFIKSSCPQRCG
jgi:hypothetical protein